MEPVLNIVLSVITAFAAIVALGISVAQIIKSNKQSLFDRRLKAYLTVKWMKSLCDSNKELADDYLKDAEEGPLHALDYFFVLMTNTTFLEGVQSAISHVLEPEYQRVYLLKIEELRNLCEEVRLIFPEYIGYPLADFIFYYEEMLVAIYKYQVAFENISKKCTDSNKPFPGDNALENSQRKTVKKYISGTFELSERVFGYLETAKRIIKL